MLLYVCYCLGRVFMLTSFFLSFFCILFFVVYVFSIFFYSNQKRLNWIFFCMFQFQFSFSVILNTSLLSSTCIVYKSFVLKALTDITHIFHKWVCFVVVVVLTYRFFRICVVVACYYCFFPFCRCILFKHYCLAKTNNLTLTKNKRFFSKKWIQIKCLHVF